MEIPKINTPGNAGAPDAPASAPVPAFTAQGALGQPGAMPVQIPRKMAQFYVPAFWDIQPDPESDGVIAINNVTNDRFVGSQKEFGAMLKGA